MNQTVQTPDSSSETQDTDVLIIEPKPGWRMVDFREIWRYRELLGFLVWRDVIVRYKQSIVGIGWAIIQPVMTMVVFTIFFGKLAKIPSDGIPYPIFSYCALLPWQYFARSLGSSSGSLVGGANLISKVYFPRMILPLSSVFGGLVDFAIAFTILLGMMAWFQIAPTMGVCLLPLFILLAMLTALGVGLWLTALNVKYRDVKFVVPFITSLWMYASPVVYSTTLIPEKWRVIYGLNPMVSVIEGFRWAMLGKAAPDWNMMAMSLLVVVVVLITGAFYFRRMEKTFADVV